jgi:hypothetical protein
MDQQIQTRYRAKLRELEDGTTGIHLVAFEEAIIHDTAGRRQWTKESEFNSEQPDRIIGELRMDQAAALLASLAHEIGYMAAEHPECKPGGAA